MSFFLPIWAKISVHIWGPWSWLQPVCPKYFTFFNFSAKNDTFHFAADKKTSSLYTRIKLARPNIAFSPSDCGDPTPALGSVNDSATTYGAVVFASCFAGYNLVGSSMLTCQDDGTWSDAPTCFPSGTLNNHVFGFFMRGKSNVTCRKPNIHSRQPPEQHKTKPYKHNTFILLY